MKSKSTVIFAIIICVIIFIALGFIMFLRICIPDFYKMCQSEYDIPGLEDGFIPQGLSYVQGDDIFITCGYMNDNSASRIYLFNDEENMYVSLIDSDGNMDTTHAGGIAYWKDYVFMAHDSAIAVYNWKDVKVASMEHGNVSPVASFEVGFETAFCYVYDDIIYVGEFYKKGKYDTPQNHHLITDNKDEHHALICTYDLKKIKGSNFEEIKPLYAYSIPDLVQGMCFDDSGKIYIATSWGLAFSHIFVYEQPNSDKVDCKVKIKDENVPVYYLDSAHKIEDLKFIPMCEELYYKDGKVFFINESASKKYKFGKFMYGKKVYSLSQI